MCGENVTCIKIFRVHLGSPPRVRGKLTINSVVDSMRRITPACAGKTGKIQAYVTFIEDHPRVCGEN